MIKKYYINIIGSTGEIGSKTLYILKNFFPMVKVNLLVANQNYKKLIDQTNSYHPEFVCLFNESKIKFLKKEIRNTKTKIIGSDEIYDFIQSTKSDISLLSSSGYQSINYFFPLLNNTKILGLVNKECVVSAGHLFNKLSKNKRNKIYPLDSEHYSLQNLISSTNKKNIKNFFITASGGPFLNKNLREIKDISLEQAKKHPKWNMGYKNSIDSATLSNKCLEIIEAHYLFNLPFSKLNILIHPEALIHSILEYYNYNSIMNYFYHDMFIPLINFINVATKESYFPVTNKQYDLESISSLSFSKPKINQFPIFKIFSELDKSQPVNLIKFNCANEFAVNLFVRKKINYGKIYKIIEKSLSIDFNSNVNDVRSIIEFQNNYIRKLKLMFG